MKRRIVFEASAFEDFNDWATTDKKIHKKIVTLLKDIERSLFSGIGKRSAEARLSRLLV